MAEAQKKMKIYRGEGPPPPPPPRPRRPDAPEAVQQAMSHRPAPTPEQIQAQSQDEIRMWTLEAVQASLVRRAKPQVRGAFRPRFFS